VFPHFLFMADEGCILELAWPKQFCSGDKKIKFNETARLHTHTHTHTHTHRERERERERERNTCSHTYTHNTQKYLDLNF